MEKPRSRGFLVFRGRATRGTAREAVPNRFIASSYCSLVFWAAGCTVVALGFAVRAAITGFGCQKSGAAANTSSGGLLSSGENRYSADSVLSTDSAFTCKNRLYPSSPKISRRVGFLSNPPSEVRKEET